MRQIVLSPSCAADSVALGMGRRRHEGHSSLQSHRTCPTLDYGLQTPCTTCHPRPRAPRGNPLSLHPFENDTSVQWHLERVVVHLFRLALP